MIVPARTVPGDVRIDRCVDDGQPVCRNPERDRPLVSDFEQLWGKRTLPGGQNPSLVPLPE